jgi:hypothetical protein
MGDSLARLKQIADEIRSLPDEHGGHASFVLQTGGALIVKAIKLGAFSGKEHAGFRAKVINARRDAKQTSPKSWRNWVFNVAANHFAPRLFAKRDGVQLVCGPIADALEADIRHMEAHPAPPPAAKPEQGKGNGGKKRRGAPPKKTTKQRADFAKPLVDKGLTWPEIFDKYNKTSKGKADKDANADAMRLAYGREYPAE